MNTLLISSGFFLMGGLLHVVFFLIESYFFQKPDGYKYFKMPKEDHGPAKLWALNQGFYNLFLALGVFAGLYFGLNPVVYFCALSMIGAGVVLWVTSPRLARGALVQMLPPLLGFIFLFLPRS